MPYLLTTLIWPTKWVSYCQLFQKNGYDFNVCNNVKHILHNTDVIISIVELIVHGPVGKLV